MNEQSKKTSQICKICGTSAHCMNFGILSCSSCKMFFKRNAESRKNSFTCDFDNECDIDIYNRRVCSACRLKKCFTEGMQIELIRGSRLKKNVRRQKKTDIITSLTVVKSNEDANQPQQLFPMNLLRSDQSTLNGDQWNLLTNLVHCYDEYSGFQEAQLFSQEQTSLLLKLRYKFEPTSKFITLNMTRGQQIFEKNADFRSLSCSDRSILLRNTVKHTACLGATFVLHKAELLQDPLFYQTSASIFGLDVMSTIISLIESFDCDETFFKLIITIIAFSTTTYTVYSDNSFDDVSDLKRILQIQDTYIELAWKYMIYKYTYDQAVRRFCGLIRCLFRVNYTIVEVDRIREYRNMIETVVEQTEQLLISNE